jgi:hypothetical protein
MPIDTFPELIAFDGEIDVQAAEDGGDSSPKFFILANTGRPMMLAGYMDPVIIDIAGAKLAKKNLPIIADHVSSLRIGHAEDSAIIPAGGKATVAGRNVKGPSIALAGVVSSSMNVAKAFVADSRQGYPFEASVGARIVEAEYLDEGEKAEVNGKMQRGPLIIARKTLIRETSVLTLGADDKTLSVAASVAASQYTRGEFINSTPKTKKDNSTVKFADFVASHGFDAEKLTDKQRSFLTASYRSEYGDSPPVTAKGGDGDSLTAVERARAEAAEEERRLDDIRATFRDFADVDTVEYGGKEYAATDFKAHAISEGMNPDKVKVALMKAALAQGGPKAPAVHVKNRNVQAQALEAAILRDSGNVPYSAENLTTGKRYGLEAMFKPEVLEEAERPQYRFGNSIQALYDMQIRVAGKHPVTDRKSAEFIAQTVDAWQTIRAAGGSGLNLVNVLENTMHKASLASFNAVESVWPFITGRMSLGDFRPHNLYRLDFDGDVKQVGHDGELKHVGMTDSKETIKADTFGAMIAINRQTLIDDDLGKVLAKARGIGTLTSKRIEKSVFAVLLDGSSSFFDAGNNNLITDSLSVAGLTAARQLFRNQSVNGSPTGVSPRILLVGTTLETDAENLYNEMRFEIGGGNNDERTFVRNPHKGLYRPYVSPYLNNTDLTVEGDAYTNQSDTQYFLFADPNAPQGAAIAIGFLNGRSTPYFESAESQFNVPGGMQFRTYLDWGVALHVPQMAVKSTGDDS